MGERDEGLRLSEHGGEEEGGEEEAQAEDEVEVGGLLTGNGGGGLGWRRERERGVGSKGRREGGREVEGGRGS